MNTFVVKYIKKNSHTICTVEIKADNDTAARQLVYKHLGNDINILSCEDIATPYIKNGYNNRDHYLRSLAMAYNVDYETVKALADALGPNEDFDGLVEELRDLELTEEFYCDTDDLDSDEFDSDLDYE